jgi:hypothetical protein
VQVTNFDKESVLVNDASDSSVSAILNQTVNDELAPISFYRGFRHLLDSTAELTKKCLAILFGCKRCRSCEISSSHVGEYEVQICLLGCAAVENNCRQTFQRYVSSP